MINDYHVPASDGTTETRWCPELIEAKHIREWFVMYYDDEAYPGSLSLKWKSTA